MSADLKAAMQADYEEWKSRKAVMGGDGLLLRIWNDAYEAAWNRRAPLPAEQPSMSELIATHQVPQAKRMAELCAEQPSHPVPLTDADILADETLQYHFGLNGGAGPVSKKGWKIINAVARIVGQQTKGGGNG